MVASILALTLASCVRGPTADRQRASSQPSPDIRAEQAVALRELERARRLVARARLQGASQQRIRRLRIQIEQTCARNARRSDEHRRAYDCYRALARLEKSDDERHVALSRAVDAGQRAGVDAARLALLTERASKGASTSPRRRRRAGELWLEAGDVDRAISHLLAAWRHDRNDVELGRRLGGLFERRGEDQRALEIYRRLHRIEPAHPQIGLNLASLEAENDRPDRAEGVYLQLLKYHRENPSILLRYAEFLERRGHRGRAEQLRSRARRQMPGVEERKMRQLQ